MNEASEHRTVFDPFEGKDVRVWDRLVDRLRGKYACGPHLPNGNPEFGWRQFQAPPIQHEAAARIDFLEVVLSDRTVERDAAEARIAQLEAELHAIKYEVMGGEDVPMSACAVTIDDVKKEMERLRAIEINAREPMQFNDTLDTHTETDDPSKPT